MTDARDIVETLGKVAEQQRLSRGDYMDYGTPDAWVIDAANEITSLRKQLEEARRRFEYASRQYHNTQDWYGEESPEAGKSLHDWFMDALGPLPAPPSE